MTARIKRVKHAIAVDVLSVGGGRWKVGLLALMEAPPRLPMSIGSYLTAIGVTSSIIIAFFAGASASGARLAGRMNGIRGKV